MRSFSQISTDCRKLLPLQEDGVESFEDLADELSELGTIEAAVELLRLIDHECPLGGVMQVVIGRLVAFPSSVAIQAFLLCLLEVHGRAGFHLNDVVRIAIRRAEWREELVRRAKEVDSETLSVLRSLVVRVGRFRTYEDGARDLLQSLPET